MVNPDIKILLNFENKCSTTDFSLATFQVKMCVSCVDS